MANKPLQTIKFPGLTDTYTVPQVDSNFTGTAGQVPDSKKVHDEIDSLKEDLKSVSQSLSFQGSNGVIWQIGTLSASDGTKVNADTNRLRSNYIPSYVKGFTCNNGTGICVSAYAQDDTYIGRWTGSGYVKEGTTYFTELSEFPNPEYKYILLLRDNNAPSADVTLALADNVTFDIDLTEYSKQELKAISGDVSNLTTRVVQNTIQWKRNSITVANGNVNQSVKFLITEFLPESVQKAVCTTGYGLCAIAYYKSNGNYAGFYNGKVLAKENVAATGYFTELDFAYLHERYPAAKWLLLLSNRADTSAQVQLAEANNVTITYEGQTVEEIANDVAYPYKPYKSGHIFFNVTVNKPVAFDGEEMAESTETVEAVLMLPTTYTPNGKKTRLVMCCHGAHGYIDTVNDAWYSYASKWHPFLEQLLAEGYAVFDANVVGGNDTSIIGYALGSPLYVQTLKKAYDYITEHYNVYEKIFVHGVSMGGVGASRFSNTYPELCLAESSFAGRDLFLYIKSYYDNHDITGTLVNIGIVHGYDSDADMLADHFGHILGYPSLTIQKYQDGVLVPIPDRETDFDNWAKYYADIINGTDDSDTYYVGRYSVPYKSWNSVADNALSTALEETFAKAYTRGSAVPHYAVTYQTGTHNDICFGLVNDMVPQLIQWYHRWE